MTQPAVRVDVGELLGRPGATERADVSVEADGLANETAQVDGPIQLAVELESLGNRVLVTGGLVVPWRSDCRRCLEPTSGRAAVEILELYVGPGEDHARSVPASAQLDDGLPDEALPIDEDQHIDLWPVVRDEALCALPLTALCGPDCRGPVPGAFETTDDPDAAAGDPRWAALDELVFDDD